MQEHIRSLVIPPAWTNVWISPIAISHLQATGRDARGRKQYRYHQKWRSERDETKYSRMIVFSRSLPKIRIRVDADLQRSGLPREKVLATVARLLEKTFIRIGHPEYAKENKSFGLTTMRDGHVDIHASSLDFHFRGKSGVYHEIKLDDRRMARIVKQCRDIPGFELFQYIDADRAKAHGFELNGAPIADYNRQHDGNDSLDLGVSASGSYSYEVSRELNAIPTFIGYSSLQL